MGYGDSTSRFPNKERQVKIKERMVVRSVKLHLLGLSPAPSVKKQEKQQNDQLSLSVNQNYCSCYCLIRRNSKINRLKPYFLLCRHPRHDIKPLISCLHTRKRTTCSTNKSSQTDKSSQSVHMLEKILDEKVIFFCP